MQELSDIEMTDSIKDVSCLKWTMCNGRRKVGINFQTDTDMLNVVVYRYRKCLCFKDVEDDLKLTEYQSLLAKRVYLLSCFDRFYKRCIVLDETTVNTLNKLCQPWMFPL